MGEFERLVGWLEGLGATVHLLPEDPETGMDSIYVRDAAVVCDRGVILCSMGKTQRSDEPAAQGRFYEEIGVPIAGRIEPPGTLEGGDVAWLDDKTLVVGRGYRTNDDGIRQLGALLEGIAEVVPVHLPHHKGPSDVFHVMSVWSPIDNDLALVHSPLMPVTLRELLLERGLQLVEVPTEEFDSLGCNVLAVAPRHCVMVSGNPRTKAGLERAGAQVHEISGSEICLKGCGGPTCLTRPLERS